MRKLIAILAVALLGFSGVARGGSLDNTAWTVTARSCDGARLSPAEDESVRFAPSIFAHIFRVSGDQSQYCVSARVFTRFVQSFSFHGESLLESGILYPRQERTVCRREAGGDVLSDMTSPMTSQPLGYSVSLNGGAGYVELTGSSECAGVLLLELEKKLKDK